MPQRHLKALIRPAMSLTAAVLVFLALMPLTACLPDLVRTSTVTRTQPAPAPKPTTITAPPSQAAPQAAAAPAPQIAAAAAPAPQIAAAPPPQVVAPQVTAASAPESAAPAGAAPGYQLYVADPLAPSPDPWPRAFTFVSALIDQRRLLEPLSGPLVTAQAGGRLLLANGLFPAEDGPDPLSELLPSSPSSAEMPESVPMALAAAAASEADPAPSAGTAEAPPTVSVVSLNAVNLKRTTAKTEDLLTSAYEQTGRHYKSGGLSPAAGFDAAGYAHWVFADNGLNLPKTPAALAAAGREVARDDLRPGDVLIYRNPTDRVGGWHVGIYSGQGNFLHASPKAGVVTETDAFGPQYAPFFLGARRFFDDPEAAPLPETQKMAATSHAVKLALTELGPEDKVVRPAPPKKAARKAP